MEIRRKRRKGTLNVAHRVGMDDTGSNCSDSGMRVLEQYRLDGVKYQPELSSLSVGLVGNASVFRLFRTLPAVLPVCFLIFLCLISIAFVLPSFLFNELLPQPPLHGPITFRYVIISFPFFTNRYEQIETARSNLWPYC